MKNLKAKVSEFTYNHPRISAYLATKPIEIIIVGGAYILYPEATRAAMSSIESNLHLFVAAASAMPHDVLSTLDNARQICQHSLDSVDSAVDVIRDISSKIG